MTGRVAIAALATTLGLVAPRQATAATCTTTATRGATVPVFMNPPSNSVLGNNFLEEAGVSSPSGDVVFGATPKGIGQHLYLAPGGSAPYQIVAGPFETAPDTPTRTYRGRNAFSSPSINSSSDVAFHALLNVGEGIFVGPTGSLEKAVADQDAVPGAPPGTFFVSFPAVSRINDSGVIAFAGVTTDPAENGIFQYDSNTNTLSPRVVVGDAAPGGRFFCQFGAVALSDDNDGMAFYAVTETAAACDGTGDPLAGVYLEDGGITEIALQGNVSPVSPGANYLDFLGTPAINGSNDVAFRATITDPHAREFVFLWQGGITDDIVGVGTPAPPTPPSSGIIQKIRAIGLTDGGTVYVSTRLRPASQGFAILSYPPAAGTSVLRKSDAPPAPFSPGAGFLRFDHDEDSSTSFAITPDGSLFTQAVRVRDSAAPRQKSAIMSCAP